MKTYQEMFKDAFESAVRKYNLVAEKQAHHKHRQEQIEKIKHETKIYKLLFKKHIFLS